MTDEENAVIEAAIADAKAGRAMRDAQLRTRMTEVDPDLLVHCDALTLSHDATARAILATSVLIRAVDALEKSRAEAKAEP